MKLELIGHDEKYALEQSLLTLFPGEKPVYGTVDKTADTRWARVTLTEEDERVQVTTELGMDGKSAAHSYDYPLSGTEYEKEGQRRHAVGISFFGAAKDLLGISPAWGSLTGVRPSKVALSLIREGGKKRAEKELQELYCVTPARARLAIEAADAGIRAAAELEPNDISLYVGIPFCPTRCAAYQISRKEIMVANAFIGCSFVHACSLIDMNKRIFLRLTVSHSKLCLKTDNLNIIKMASHQAVETMHHIPFGINRI